MNAHTHRIRATRRRVLVVALAERLVGRMQTNAASGPGGGDGAERLCAGHVLVAAGKLVAEDGWWWPGDGAGADGLEEGEPS